MVHRVTVLAYEGMSAFETGIVTEVFGLARPEVPVPWYDLTICAERPGPLRIVGGATIGTEHGLEVFAVADTLIVPGVTNVRDDTSPELIAALRMAYDRGARIVSICSGAFALAAAGLLDHRPATTHWQYADLLRRRFPLVRVDPDVLYLDDGQVLTSAGSAAGLDLCLHLVRLDHGARVANALARRLVVPPHREGGQAQYVERPVPPDGDDGLGPVLDWARANLERPLTVDQLARCAGMSVRTFARRFEAQVGTTPLQWLIGERGGAARELLESTDLPVELVADRCGFGTAASLRLHFQRLTGTSPLAYRRAFRYAAS